MSTAQCKQTELEHYKSLNESVQKWLEHFTDETASIALYGAAEAMRDINPAAAKELKQLQHKVDSRKEQQ